MGGSFIVALGVDSTRIVLALVQRPTVGVGIASGSRRTFTDISSILIDTSSSSSAGIAQTFIEVNTLGQMRIIKYDLTRDKSMCIHLNSNHPCVSADGLNGHFLQVI